MSEYYRYWNYWLNIVVNWSIYNVIFWQNWTMVKLHQFSENYTPQSFRLVRRHYFPARQPIHTFQMPKFYYKIHSFSWSRFLMKEKWFWKLYFSWTFIIRFEQLIFTRWTYMFNWILCNRYELKLRLQLQVLPLRAVSHRIDFITNYLNYLHLLRDGNYFWAQIFVTSSINSKRYVHIYQN